MSRILQFIGLAFAATVSFIGLLYLTQGQLAISASVVTLLTVLLYTVVSLMIKKKEELTKHRFKVDTLIYWLLYLIVSTPICLLAVHSLNVEMNAKDEVQSLAKQKISALSDLLSAFDEYAYESVNEYKTNLQTAIYSFQSTNDFSELNSTYGIDNSDKSAVRNNTYDYEAYHIDPLEVKFDKQKEDVSDNIVDFKTQYQDVFSGWSRLDLSLAFYELNQLLQESADELEEKADDLNNEYDLSQTLDLDLSIVNKEFALNDPLGLWNKYKPYTILIVVLVLQVLLLLPYMIAKGAGKYGPTIKGGGNDRDGVEI